VNQRRHLTLIAAVATVMATFPLSTLFQLYTWLFQGAMMTALVFGVAMAARAVRVPVWAQPLIGLVVVLFGLTWMQADGHALGGLIPDADTFRYFGSLVGQAGTDMNDLAIPVQDTPGLLFLTNAGLGAVAVLIDFLAIGLRKPALAGLPMLAVYTVPVEIDPRSVSIIPFVIGAVGFLWLLVSDSVDRVRLFGRRFSGEGRGIDMWESSPLAAVGRRIAVVGVLLAVIVPVAVPGFSTGFVHQFGNGTGPGGDGTGSCTGLCRSSTVDLFANLTGKLTQGKTTLLAKVKTNDPVPGYLRFGVADQIGADRWSTSASFGPPLKQAASSPTPAPAPGVTYTQHQAQVTILGNLNVSLLPVYLSPEVGTFKGLPDAWNYDASTSVVFSPKQLANKLTYSFDYVRPDYTQAALRSAPPLGPDDPMRSYTQLPKTSVPEVDKIVRDQTAGTTNEYDAVLNLYLFFSTKNHFTYSLNTKAGTTGTAIGDFLQTRQGYCQQYALALAWLVRAAGYPSRVAFGFTGGEPDKKSGTYDLTNLDLHAWTEVYFPGFGWVPFDATPSGQLEGAVRTQWAPPADGSVRQSTSAHPSDGTSASGSAGGVPAKETHLDGGTGPGGVAGGKSGSDWPWWVLGGVVVLLLILISPALARSLVRGRRAAASRRADPEPSGPGEPWVDVGVAPEHAAAARRAHTAWDEFMDTLVDYAIPIDPTETPKTTSERIARSLHLPPEASESARAIGTVEQQARYARRPMPADGLDADLKRFRRAIAAHVSRRTRLRALLLPPSVVQRWSETTMYRLNRVVSGWQRIRDRVYGALNLRWWMSAPRRLLAGRSGR
jgi:transglutaminase-like putative cysteine protease